MEKTNKSSSAKENLRNYVKDLIENGCKPAEIVRMIEEDGIDTAGLTWKRVYKMIDHTTRNVRKAMEGKKTEEAPKYGDDLVKFVTEAFERHKLKGVVGKAAVTSIRSMVKERLNETLDNSEIVSILKSARSAIDANRRRRASVERLNEEIDDVKKYDVVNGNYVFKIRKLDRYGEEFFLNVELPVRLVDGLFYDFSRHGKNMSSLEVRRKYRLKPEVFNALKSRLGLYKSSNVISPYTLENSSEEELRRIISNGVNRSIRDKYKEKFVRTYDSVFEKEAKKAMKIAGNVEDVVRLVREGIAEMDPIAVNRDIIEKRPYNPDVAIFLTSDYHYGESDDDLITSRIRRVVDDMVSTPERHIHWLSLGDLAETFMEEGMHPGQVNKMRKRGFELVRFVYKTFVGFFMRVINSGKTLEIDWQGGNHDRAGKTNDMDRARTWALTIGEMIELSLRNYIDRGLVKFNNHKRPTIRKKVGKLAVIAHHGDGAFHKLRNSDVLAKYGFGAEHYHLILEGDKHHFIAERDTNSMRVVTSSIKSDSDYAENVIHKSSVPGYVKVTETKTGKARVTMAMLD